MTDDSKRCHVCGDDCVPADLFECDRPETDWICPTCAPSFVLARATSHSDETDPFP